MFPLKYLARKGLNKDHVMSEAERLEGRMACGGGSIGTQWQLNTKHSYK